MEEAVLSLVRFLLFSLEVKISSILSPGLDIKEPPLSWSSDFEYIRLRLTQIGIRLCRWSWLRENMFTDSSVGWNFVGGVSNTSPPGNSLCELSIHRVISRIGDEIETFTNTGFSILFIYIWNAGDLWSVIIIWYIVIFNLTCVLPWLRCTFLLIWCMRCDTIKG